MRNSNNLNNITIQPTLDPTQTHYCSNAFMLLADDDDDKTIITSNRSTNATKYKVPTIFHHKGYNSTATAWKTMLADHEQQHGQMPQTMLNTGGIRIAVDMAVADAGATSHFVLPGAPVKNVTQTKTPLVITLPDGQTLKSTHTCMLDAPWLPEKARHAHIVPGLAHTSLISIKSLCDAGCKVAYDEDEVRVYFKCKLVWTGNREPTTGLWVLPLNAPHAKRLASARSCSSMMLMSTTKKIETSFNAYKMTSKQALIKYLHQCLFSPPKSTLVHAIEQNYFPTWPGFTAAAVKRYLPETSPATDKGHMRRQRKGLRSTTKQ